MGMNLITASKRYHFYPLGRAHGLPPGNSTYTVKELTLRLTRLLCQFIRGLFGERISDAPGQKECDHLCQFLTIKSISGGTSLKI